MARLRGPFVFAGRPFRFTTNDQPESGDDRFCIQTPTRTNRVRRMAGGGAGVVRWHFARGQDWFYSVVVDHQYERPRTDLTAGGGRAVRTRRPYLVPRVMAAIAGRGRAGARRPCGADVCLRGGVLSGAVAVRGIAAGSWRC